MPRTTDAPTDADLRAALARLVDGRRVRMCVPPQPDDDDMLLAAALDELAEARPVVALIERAATETYMGANEELLLMAKGRAFDRLIATWDQLDHARALAARDGGEEAAAPPR